MDICMNVAIHEWLYTSVWEQMHLHWKCFPWLYSSSVSWGVRKWEEIRRTERVHAFCKQRTELSLSTRSSEMGQQGRGRMLLCLKILCARSRCCLSMWPESDVERSAFEENILWNHVDGSGGCIVINLTVTHTLSDGKQQCNSKRSPVNSICAPDM